VADVRAEDRVQPRASGVAADVERGRHHRIVTFTPEVEPLDEKSPQLLRGCDLQAREAVARVLGMDGPALGELPAGHRPPQRPAVLLVEREEEVSVREAGIAVARESREAALLPVAREIREQGPG